MFRILYYIFLNTIHLNLSIKITDNLITSVPQAPMIPGRMDELNQFETIWPGEVLQIYPIVFACLLKDSKRTRNNQLFCMPFKGF